MTGSIFLKKSWFNMYNSILYTVQYHFTFSDQVSKKLQLLK